MKLTRYIAFQLLLLIVCSLPAAATVRPETVDSLLKVYTDNPNNKEVAARQILDFCLEGDLLTEEPLSITAGMPADSIDLMVYYRGIINGGRQPAATTKGNSKTIYEDNRKRCPFTQLCSARRSRARENE